MKAYISKDIKNMNRKTIYKCIVNSPGQTTSCARIARETHISLPTVIKMTEFLQKKNLLYEVDEIQGNLPGSPRSAIGRPPSMLKFNPESYLAVGAAFNGEFLEISVIDLNFDTVLSEKFRTNISIDELMHSFFAATLDQLLEKNSIRREKLIGIGLALPVILDTKNLRSDHPAPLIGLSQPYDFKETGKTISRKYGCPFYMENDVNSAALAEFKAGPYDEKDDLIFISVGNGVGGGIILDGRLRRGNSYAAGEIGYMVFSTEHLSGIDQAGYIEDKLSPEFLLKRFGYSVFEDNSATDSEILIRVAEHISSYLSLCIANLSIALDVDKFVVGGFVIDGLEDLVLRFTQEKITRFGLNPIFLKSTMNEYAASLGIGALAIDRSIDDILNSEADAGSSPEGRQQ
ncbi:MAG: ROK family protein [Saccharofermentanales bacterium]